MPQVNQHIYARMTKVDEALREVHGVAASSHPDHAKEILDYKTSKPNFQKWSKNAADATSGKSVGNVRVMHKNDVAGKLTALMFNDEAEQIEVVAKIVDDNEWKKVLEGCYTGFSIGGSYVGAKWDDPVHKGHKRYTADPVEVSLVDLPCIPNATFSVVKADGTTLQKSFAASVATGSDESGVVDASVSGANISATAAAANPMEKVNALATRLLEIQAAAKEPVLQRFGKALLAKYKAGDEALVKAVDLAMSLTKRQDLEKGLYTVEILLDALRDLKCADSDMMMAAAFGDDQSTPESMAALKAVMNDLVAVIVGMLSGEVSDDDEVVIVELAKPIEDLSKSKPLDAPVAAIAAIEQPAAVEPANEDLQKSLAPMIAEMTKMRSGMEDLQKAVKERDAAIFTLTQKVNRPATRTLGKEDDNSVLNKSAGGDEQIKVVRDAAGNVDPVASVFKFIHSHGGTAVKE